MSLPRFTIIRLLFWYSSISRFTPYIVQSKLLIIPVFCKITSTFSSTVYLFNHGISILFFTTKFRAPAGRWSLGGTRSCLYARAYIPVIRSIRIPRKKVNVAWKALEELEVVRGASKRETKLMKKRRVDNAAARAHLFTKNMYTKHSRFINRNITLRVFLVRICSRRVIAWILSHKRRIFGIRTLLVTFVIHIIVFRCVCLPALFKSFCNSTPVKFELTKMLFGTSPRQLPGKHIRYLLRI